MQLYCKEPNRDLNESRCYVIIVFRQKETKDPKQILLQSVLHLLVDRFYLIGCAQSLFKVTKSHVKYGGTDITSLFCYLGPLGDTTEILWYYRGSQVASSCPKGLKNPIMPALCS